MDFAAEIQERQQESGTISINNIPADLVRHNQWVCWKFNDRAGKTTKVPVNIRTGRYASVSEPGTWASFGEARDYFEANRANGIEGLGFVFTLADPFVGVDLDDCFDPETGAMEESAKRIMRELNSYTELSPSRRGVHILVKGKLPAGERRTGKIEMYDSSRFFTVTGNHIEGTPGTIEDRQAELENLHKRLFRLTVVPETTARTEEGGSGLSDEELIAKASAAKNGEKFMRLWQGEITGYSSPSEADLALCRLLAYWCDKDPGRVDQLFRKSGLFRPKWDEQRGPQTYGAITIAQAISQGSGWHTDSGSPIPTDDAPLEVDNIVDELNKKHAVIMVGGRCCVINEAIDPVFKRPDITFSSFNDLRNWYGNKLVEVHNGRGGTTLEPITKVWLQSENRRTYNGIVFSPGTDCPGYYNLYRGLSVEPIQGDWSLMKTHLKEVIAGDDESIYQYLLAWMADLIQNPGGERVGTSIVMRGKQGVGKGAFTSQLGEIFGSHFLHITNPAHIVNRFNQHLKDALLVFIDEGFWAGDKAAEGVLKGMVTEKYFMCEPKGKDAFPVENHVHLIIASNNSWVVPAGFEERRFMVLDVSDKYAGCMQYFTALFNQMDNGGREAMLYDLLSMDYSAVNLRVIPRTKALLDQILYSASPLKKFWHVCLYNGTLIDNVWRLEVPTQKLYDAYLDFANKCNIHGYRLDIGQFGKELRALCQGIKRVRPTIDNGRVYVLQIPSLEHCRTEFEQLVGLSADDLDWPVEDEPQRGQDDDIFSNWGPL